MSIEEQIKELDIDGNKYKFIDASGKYEKQS